MHLFSLYWPYSVCMNFLKSVPCLMFHHLFFCYFCRHSMILLALVDHRYRFRFVNVGSPGRCHDAYVYQRSQLATAVEGPLFRAPLAVISGTAVPPLILCDQAFPLTPNLVKPFPHRGQLSEEQKTYNYHLSRSRRIVENAFGRMKARFRFVLKRMECDIERSPGHPCMLCPQQCVRTFW